MLRFFTLTIVEVVNIDAIRGPNGAGSSGASMIGVLGLV